MNLIDPNEEILKKQSWFVRGNKDNNIRIPDFEEVRSFVELKMRPKIEGYYEVDDTNVVTFKRTSSVGTIRLYGYHDRQNSDGTKNEYYSTRYTDELMGNNGKNKDYEGFGIKSIEVVYDANKIPIVTIVFYDLRGNVLSNFDSKFAQMFQLPYPIFELTLQGGFGPRVTYELLKSRDDISVDDSGNFIITSKFVGNKFSSLADVPLLYLMAVPYLENKSVSVNDTNIGSFHELIINVKRLYTKLESEVQSEQERINVQDLEDRRATLQSLINTKNLLTSSKARETIQSWFDDDNEFKGLAEDSKTRIQNNYIDIINEKNNIVYFTSVFSSSGTGTGNRRPKSEPLNNLTYEEFVLVKKIIDTNVLNTNTVLKSQKSISGNLLVTKTNSYLKDNNGNLINLDIVSELSFDLVVKEIQSIERYIIAKSENFASNLENRLKNLVVKFLGGTRLTVGSVFKILLEDYNKLLDKVYTVAEAAKNDTTRSGNKSIRDTIPFPTVVRTDSITGGQTIVFPGEINEFKEWPEVKFVNEFIEAYFKSVRNNYITEILNEKNDNGSSKYIPFNPREIYPNTTVQSIENVYFNKSNTNNISELIYNRFQLLGNITIPLTKFSTQSNSINYPAPASKWKFGSSDDTSFFSSIIKFFEPGNTDTVGNEDTAKNIFLTYIQFEATNIAFAISSDDKMKNWFKVLNTQLKTSTDDPSQPNYYFTRYSSSEIALNKTPSAAAGNILGIKKADENYITISNASPTPITANDGEAIKYIQDIIKEYKCTFTVDNILYTKDDKLQEKENESDYEEGLDNTVSKQYNNNSATVVRIPRLYNNYYQEKSPINSDTIATVQGTFDFSKLSNSSKYLGLVEIPKGGLIILGARASITPYPIIAGTNPSIQSTAKRIDGININIIKDSTFEKEILRLWNEFSTKFHYKITPVNNTSNLGYEIKIDPAFASSVDYNSVLTEFYTPYFVSINDYRAATDNARISESLTSNGYALNTIPDYIYVNYLKLLVEKVNENVKEIDKKVNDRFSAFETSIKDGDVKLSTYKTFQVIYENFIHKRKSGDHQLTVGEDFKFVDRAYNDISGLPGSKKSCVLDMKTMLSDVNDSNVSILSAISRLLSDNNFWFYPFQGFLTTDETYNQLFDINYDKNTETHPLFIAMYVGGLSSNPSTVKGYDINDDGIKEGDIPSDFGTGLNAFLVKYTGLQNQMVFSNFQHSTESLKNTDEGLRIQSEIVNQASNSFAIPKGQSLLNVYQKQSYSSTIKIPFGNMGIQPTQYYYEKFIPIFEGLYIIYNVSHSIDSDTQRLETTFKGYRLKKDTNPIVEQELIDFIKNNAYRRLQSELRTVEQPGKDITTAASKVSNILIIENQKKPKNAFYEIKQHHDPILIKKHKVISAGNREWSVAYRNSSTAYSDAYKNTTNYTTIIDRDTNLEHVVADFVIKKGNSLFGIPAPFDGKVVGNFVDGGNNPVMCLLDATGLKTCIILHWEKGKKLNETFQKGEIIANIGNVGQSDGAHLHLEFMTIDDYIDYINFILSVSPEYDGKKRFI
jgi:hypothetical protein